MTVALLILLTISSLIFFLNKEEVVVFDPKHTLPLRGILAVLVVLGHLDTMVAGQTKILMLIHMATPAVAVFFFMSGYGLMQSYSKKGDNYLNRFIVKSAVKLLIPLLVTTLLYQAYLFVKGDFCLKRIVDDFITGVEMPLVHSWYVYALFLFYFIFYFVFKNLKINRSIGCKISILTSLILVYYVVARYCFDWDFFWWLTCMAFPMGFIYSNYEDKIKSCVNYTHFSIVPILLVVLLVIKFLSNPNAILFAELPYLLLGPIVALVLCRCPLPIGNRVLNFLGTLSFEIYLTHGVFEKLLFNCFNSPYLYIFAVIMFTIFVSWVLHIIYQKITFALLNNI
jgi:peptidoglycan/LPS O-acetylase OafA/YrhL